MRRELNQNCLNEWKNFESRNGGLDAAVFLESVGREPCQWLTLRYMMRVSGFLECYRQYGVSKLEYGHLEPFKFFIKTKNIPDRSYSWARWTQFKYDFLNPRHWALESRVDAVQKIMSGTWQEQDKEQNTYMWDLAKAWYEANKEIWTRFSEPSEHVRYFWTQLYMSNINTPPYLVDVCNEVLRYRQKFVNGYGNMQREGKNYAETEHVIQCIEQTIANETLEPKYRFKRSLDDNMLIDSWMNCLATETQMASDNDKKDFMSYPTLEQLRDHVTRIVG